MTLRPLLARSLDEALALIDVIADVYAAGDKPLPASLIAKMQEWEVSANIKLTSSPLERNLLVELKPAVSYTPATGTLAGTRLQVTNGPAGLYGHIEHLTWHMAVLENPRLLARTEHVRVPNEKSSMARHLIRHYGIKPNQVAQSLWKGDDVHAGNATIRFGNRFGQLIVQQLIVGTLTVSHENHYQIENELPASALQGLQHYVGQPISKIVDLEFIREKSRIVHLTGHRGLLRAIVKTNILEADMMLGTSRCQSVIAKTVRQHRANLIQRHGLDGRQP